MMRDVRREKELSGGHLTKEAQAQKAPLHSLLRVYGMNQKEDEMSDPFFDDVSMAGGIGD